MHRSLSCCSDRDILYFTLSSVPACLKSSAIVLYSLESCSILLHHQHVLWKAGFEKLIWTKLLFTLDPLQNALHYRRSHYTLRLCGKDEDRCENTGCRLQLSIQHKRVIWTEGQAQRFRDVCLHSMQQVYIFFIFSWNFLLLLFVFFVPRIYVQQNDLIKIGINSI